MEEKDRWEQKGRILRPFISFTSFSIASLSPVYLPSLPTIYHPTLVHRHNDPEQKQCVRTYIRRKLQEKEDDKVTETEETPLTEELQEEGDDKVTETEETSLTEVEPIRLDRQEIEELLRVLAESERDVTPKYF